MFTGHSPVYTQEIPIEEPTPEQFIALAALAVTQLGWSIQNLTATALIADTDIGTYGSEIVTVQAEGTNALLQSKSLDDGTTDRSRNKVHIDALVDAITRLRTAHTTEQLQAQHQLLNPAYQAPAAARPLTTKEKFAQFFIMFRPQKGYVVTPVLFYLNLLVFIVMVATGVNFIQPDGMSLLNWGANYRPLTIGGDWWRLFTCFFIHIGIMHLLLNMYALIYIGLLLEPRLGIARFLSAYLLTGIAASLTSLAWHNYTVSAGASGAIFGMYGVFLAMLTTNHIPKHQRRALLTSIVFFVGYNLMYGLKSGIDNAAHIGGLLSGMLIGYAFMPGLKPGANRATTYGVITAFTMLTIAATVITLKSIPDDTTVYQEKMSLFAANEAKALKIYKLPDSTPTAEYITAIRDTGIGYWKKNLALLDAVDSLDLPGALYDRNELVRTYCRLRITSYQFMYRGIQEQTDKYKDSILLYNQKTQAVLDSLNKGK